MWLENHSEGQKSSENKEEGVPAGLEAAEPAEETLMENIPIFKPYPLAFPSETEDTFFRVEKNYNFRQRYFELEELLEHTVEKGKLESPELVKQVKALKKTLYYTPPNNLDELCEAEAELERLYAIVAQMAHPVNIISLRTTSEHYRVVRTGWQKRFTLFLGDSSVADNFFLQFYWVGSILFILMMFFIILMNVEKSLFTPFLFGAIGAWLYLYKMLRELAIQRLLSRDKIGFDWLRLFTGAFIGGLLVLFFKESTQEFSGTSVATLGLLGGYSVDFFYQTLDQLIQRILPKNQEQSSAAPPTPKQQQMESLIKQLKDADEEDKEVIRKLLEKL